MTDIAALRQCLIDGLPGDPSSEFELPRPEQSYVPPEHRRALSLDRPLVLGGRGAGKSFWRQSLEDDARRRLVAEAFELPELVNARVQLGFVAGVQKPDAFPDAGTLRNLLKSHCEPYDIWKAVVLRAVVRENLFPQSSWGTTTQWIADNGEAASRLLESAEAAARSEGKATLVVFDGLERLASTWEESQELLKGLLMTALDFRSFKFLRLKVFLRPDLLERRVTAFPDASKLLASSVSLHWSDSDLYGLLWQYLGNDKANGITFRRFAKALTTIPWRKVDESHPVPDALRVDTDLQRKLFHALAGKSMGGGSNRGDTWKWLPNHLADENKYVSPRSFIVAVHHAAVASQRGNLGEISGTALNWRAIQYGVSMASKVRVSELYEDFPWAEYALLPLEKIAVPCSRKDIFKAWKQFGTLERVLENQTDNKNRLPPVKVTENDPASLLSALVELGVFRTMSGDRINMPDIFRVEAKMPRRGGVPVRR